MEQKQIENYDEISLVDIFRLIWKYRIFILIFCIFSFLVGFFIFGSSIYIKNNKTPYKIYDFEINFPSISYSLFQNIILNIQYDLNTEYFYRKFDIDIKDNMVSYYIRNNNLNEKIYNISDKDFPVVQFGFEFKTTNNLNEDIRYKINSYLREQIFYVQCKNDIQNIKRPFIESKEMIIQSLNESSTEVFIFISSFNEKLDYFFFLKNSDIDKSYIQITDYLQNIYIKSNYVNEARKLLLDMINNNYQLIKKSRMDIIESVENLKDRIKELLKKEIIILIASLFISIFLVFIIDFFKKYWKDIIK